MKKAAAAVLVDVAASCKGKVGVEVFAAMQRAMMPPMETNDSAVFHIGNDFTNSRASLQ